MRVAVLAVLAVGIASIASAEAGERRSRSYEPGVGTHAKSSYYRNGGTRVRGYTARRGGYSYIWSDTINTYGNSRTLFGSANVYRDPGADRQSPGGPFDHGFFFDSAMGRWGGQAPYFH